MRGTETYWVFAIALAVGLAAGPFVRVKAIPRPSLPSQTQMDEQEALAHAPAAPRIPRPDQAHIVEPPLTPQPVSRLRLQLSRDEIAGLTQRCAPAEPAKVLTSIVRVESAGHPLRIGINGKKRGFLDPSTPAEAEAWSARMIAAGESVDLGLAQINSRNLSWLGLSIRDAFDPCRNLAAAGIVMDRGYKVALKISRPGQSVLQTAYSLYNTGNPDRGFLNGYVERLEAGFDSNHSSKER